MQSARCGYPESFLAPAKVPDGCGVPTFSISLKLRPIELGQHATACAHKHVLVVILGETEDVGRAIAPFGMGSPGLQETISSGVQRSQVIKPTAPIFREASAFDRALKVPGVLPTTGGDVECLVVPGQRQDITGLLSGALGKRGSSGPLP